MLDTGIRQIRMARSLIWGRPISTENVRRLVGDALRTLEEFGEPGDDVQQLLDGPYADPNLRESFQTRALRRTAIRAASVTPFYRDLFAEADLAPDKLTLEELPRLPLTHKQDLLQCGPDFVAEGSQPYLATRTTGTTGRPTQIWLSRQEIELWPAMMALSGLLRGEIGPDDCMQINISSRATAAVQQNVEVCGLAGARCLVLGLVPSEESLDALLEGGEAAPTLLSTYPSYLAELVRAARRRGLGPEAFRLRRVDCGGELLSPSLAAAAVETLGAVVNDTFASTSTRANRWSRARSEPSSSRRTTRSASACPCSGTTRATSFGAFRTTSSTATSRGPPAPRTSSGRPGTCCTPPGGWSRRATWWRCTRRCRRSPGPRVSRRARAATASS